MVVSGRVVPIGKGLTLSERLNEQEGLGLFQGGAPAWEVGRLVVAPGLRGGVLLPYCFMQSSRWLWENTDISDLYAVSEFALNRLYRRFAFNTVTDALYLSPEEKTKYYIANAQLADVIRVFHNNSARAQDSGAIRLAGVA